MEPLTALNTGSAALATRSTSERGLASLSSADFFKILVSELQTQDPLEPSKTSDMIGQVSQIRSIEISTKMGDTLNALVQQQRTAGITDLLGKFVTAVSAQSDGSDVMAEGVVTGVTFASDGNAVLELDTGQAVRAHDVVHVTTLERKEQLESLDAGSSELVEPADPDKQQAQSRTRQNSGLPSWFNLDWRLSL